MPQDFDTQRDETVAAFNALQAEHGLPEVADVDYFFVPTHDGADWRALAEELSRSEYSCTYVSADEAEDGTPYLAATLPDQMISATGIWIGEEVATRAALKHGFAPDGWGLES
ncbi:ribonuclease E inhibitor RraB [Pseudophaeobacter flagellatus]|uniref:ribonuclease E inhibitor RraB n=1 Tax=Pseudophaeobacter flagellatus TaxID=2899119 RepID=UPI001E2D906A|nr:ribonuclease E inhibitor RraB [Pseudophaeobacter flagellatus]MCD9149543.1 ribonuclease E inhibitor RraB [Pseudophaeobacter flagellatus]